MIPNASHNFNHASFIHTVDPPTQTQPTESAGEAGKEHHHHTQTCKYRLSVHIAGKWHTPLIITLL